MASYFFPGRSSNGIESQSLTRNSDDAALSDSDDWRFSMLQEELHHASRASGPSVISMAANDLDDDDLFDDDIFENAPIITNNRKVEKEPRMHIESHVPQQSMGERLQGAVQDLRSKVTTWMTWNKREEPVAPLPPPPQTFSDRFKNAFRDASKRLGLVKEPEREKKWYERWYEEIQRRTTLSKQTRLIGFGISFAVGLFFLIVTLLLVQYVLFPFVPQLIVFFYTISQISFILSSFFLAGPMTQIRQMITPKRIIPSCVYIIALALTIIAAIKIGSALICFILIAIQIAALVVYFVTYIPYSGTLTNFALRALWNNITS